MVLTTPMSAFYFGTVSLVGVLTNLLTLWAVSLTFYGIIAVCLVSLFWVKGAAILASLASVPMTYVIWMAKFLSAIPLAALYTRSVYTTIWLVFAYVLLTVFLLSPKRYVWLLSCCAVLGLCVSLLLSWTEHRFADTHFTALDVGQGQCLILHHKNKTFLIDCGGSNDEVSANTAAETLLSRGITHLDGIIVTHYDRDHAGGIPHLLKRIDAGFLMLPATTAPETAGMLTEDFSGEVIFVEEDLLIPLETGNLTIFAPIFVEESNENSLCVLFESENCAILVTGDRSFLGERILLHEKDIPDVDLLIAGHHGSKNSTSEELLMTAQPETVFISVGENNGYGHPAQSLLDRLYAFGCNVYRTDLHGTLIFRR
jgi:competence protein ComEC